VRTLHPTADTNAPLHITFRLTVLLLVIPLAAQCVWLLLAELARPGIDQLPTDSISATAAAKQRNAANWAASIGAFRGDLWAEAAFTYADLLWSQKGTNTNTDFIEAALRARTSLDYALHNGPHQSSAWLLLAGLALRFPLQDLDATELLKMSYYTGPSEQYLMPLRLQIGVRSDKLNDVEIRQLVGRDLRSLLTRNQRSAIAEAYDAASPVAKTFIEQTIRDINPAALDLLRPPSLKQIVPD
jgi:hypothetical protein